VTFVTRRSAANGKCGAGQVRVTKIQCTFRRYGMLGAHARAMSEAALASSHLESILVAVAVLASRVARRARQSGRFGTIVDDN
jgi:hypothetical protein